MFTWFVAWSQQALQEEVRHRASANDDVYVVRCVDAIVFAMLDDTWPPRAGKTVLKVWLLYRRRQTLNQPKYYFRGKRGPKRLRKAKTRSFKMYGEDGLKVHEGCHTERFAENRERIFWRGKRRQNAKKRFALGRVFGKVKYTRDFGSLESGDQTLYVCVVEGCCFGTCLMRKTVGTNYEWWKKWVCGKKYQARSHWGAVSRQKDTWRKLPEDVQMSDLWGEANMQKIRATLHVNARTVIELRWKWLGTKISVKNVPLQTRLAKLAVDNG